MVETHGALMDQVYRRQRFIYDLTRKYYLLGRDHALRQMQPAPDAQILEIACGTGRNLKLIDRKYPGRQLYGLDISSEMLRSAQAKLGDQVALAQGDACDFDPEALFGRAQFDCIVMSYCVSMIPDWHAAIQEAVAHLAPGGAVHIVDFGDQAGMPGWFDARLRAWLARFHVTPRDDLAAMVRGLDGVDARHTPLLRGYAQYARLDKAAAVAS